ncbi:MAG TPA: ABC transporter permease [Puia sp.]|uniref:ABC transporter permease n=1 Tax=Puia sp. TaxID=2045100 RepID=UPI002CA532EA|nr:ABC transporter permease [Puia sp.]HVU97848.1 ABC transporter permease [Puia sp.]
MLKNYLKTALRFLRNNRRFTFINIIGLSLGTLCCLYILLYVGQQYSYDRHEAQAADIYRVNTDMKVSGDHHLSSWSSPVIVPAMKKDFPEVREETRAFDASLFGADKHLLIYKDRSFFENEALFVDSNFFDVFTYRFLEGDAHTALVEPHTIVLKRATAVKLFGKEDPMGKIIRISNKAGDETLKVTGVVESLGKSHLEANAFITLNSGLIGDIIRNRITSWAGGNLIWSFVKLRPGADPRALTALLPAFLESHGGQDMRNLHIEKRLELQRIATIHTTTGYEHEPTPAVTPSFLGLLLLIAILIQLIACINFMNLSTARATKRAKEVGVRKVIGAVRGNLIRQFLGESFLLALIGIALALPLLALALPYLNAITRADIALSALRDYRIVLLLVALVIGTGLVSGSYPAFYLSAFNTVKVIKGNFTNRVSAVGLRRALVVFQFSLAILLITGIVVIYSQLHYIKQRDLGYDKSQKLVFNAYASGANVGGFAEGLRTLAGIRTVTRTNSQMGRPVIQDRGVYVYGKTKTDEQIAQDFVTDQYFLRTLGVKLIAGRDFRDTDSGRVLINETLAARLGLDPAKAPGVRLHSSYDSAVSYEIVGVIKDFNFSSLRESVNSFMLLYDPDFAGNCTVTANCSTSDYRSLLKQVAAVWRKNVPNAPFEYAFLDDEVQKQYEAEITLANIINSFTVMAIFISCLGLFGLAAFSAEQRSKEIGVRKVLGAGVSGIIRLLSTDFLKLVGVALLISIPVSWWAMHKWLDSFAYRTPIRWWMFGLSGALALLIAFLTVSFHTIRAANANPVRSLRSE